MALADVAHLEVQDAFTGEYVPLNHLWKDKPVVLGFFRRFGCMLCRYAAVQLSTLQPYLDAAGVRLVAVGFEAVGLQAFVNGNFFSGDIYVDLSRACYRGLNLENLGFLRGMAMLLTDRRVASTLKEAKNVGYGDFRGDGMQLGATFVVGTDGAVLMEHRQKHFGDNPNLDEIRVAAAQAVNKTMGWIEMEMNGARERMPGALPAATHRSSPAQPSRGGQQTRTLAVEAKKRHRSKGKKGRREQQQQQLLQQEQRQAGKLSRTTSASTAISTISGSTEDVDSVGDDDGYSVCDMSPLCSPSLLSSPDPETAALAHSHLGVTTTATTGSTSASSLVGQAGHGGVSWPGLMGNTHMSKPRFAPCELWSLRRGCCDEDGAVPEEEADHDEEEGGDGHGGEGHARANQLSRQGCAHYCCTDEAEREGNTQGVKEQDGCQQQAVAEEEEEEEEGSHSDECDYDDYDDDDNGLGDASSEEDEEILG